MNETALRPHEVANNAVYTLSALPPSIGLLLLFGLALVILLLVPYDEG